VVTADVGGTCADCVIFRAGEPSISVRAFSPRRISRTRPLCCAVGRRRHGWRAPGPVAQHYAVPAIEMVKSKRQRQPRLGTRKLHYLRQQPMHQAGIKLGRDGMFYLLRQAHMLVRPRRAYHRTTHSHHDLRRHPNLLKAGVDGQVHGLPAANSCGLRTSRTCPRETRRCTSAW